MLAGELPEPLAPAALRCLDAALAAYDQQPPGPATELSHDTVHGRLAAEFLLAALEGDRRRAAELVLARAGRATASPT